MGGGSAQVNPPYQVSVADDRAALLGDAVSVTDGVEVRRRPMPARPGVVTDPDTGQPGVHVTLTAADGSVIEERHGSPAGVVVGFDDDFDEVVHSIRFRARVHGTGPVEIGALGAGSWRFRQGDQQWQYELEVSGAGFGEEMLSPPLEVSRVELTGDDVVEGAVVLRPPSFTHVRDTDAGDVLDAAVQPLAGAGFFGLVAREAPPADPAAVIAAAAGPRRAQTWPSSWSGSPRSRRPSRWTRPRCACPGTRTSWSARSRRRPGAPSWS